MATATSPRSISVQWEQVVAIDRNGIITMYEVRYQPLDPFLEAKTVNVTELAANLTNLEGSTGYFISVRAYTSAGEGPYSIASTITTPQGKEILLQEMSGLLGTENL